MVMSFVFFQAEDGIRDIGVTGVQTCTLPIFAGRVEVHERVRGEHEPRLLAARDRLRAQDAPQAGQQRQIGRASCRERGEISVGAVSLKKNKTKSRLTEVENEE